MSAKEQHLENEIQISLAKSNNSETEVSKQVLFLAGATLALLGGLISTDAIQNDSEKILLIIGVITLMISVISGVVQFCLEFLFWNGITTDELKIKEEASKIQNQTEKDSAIRLGLAVLDNKKTNRIAFWFQIVAFILSVIILASVIVLRLAL